MSEKALEQQLEIIEKEHIENNEAANIVGLETEYIEEQDIPEEDEIIESYGAMMHSGPLPHPDILEGYERIMEGSAERILAMAEKEASHRHKIEEKCIKTDSGDSLLGVVFAFLLGMSCIASGFGIILKVPEVSGMITGCLITGTGLAGILGAFLKGTKAAWKIEREKERQ